MSELEREIEVMLGIQAGITVALYALLSTHPDHARAQLAIAKLSEHVAQKSLWPTLSDAGRAAAEDYCWQLQRIAAAPPGSDPLTTLGFLWKDR